MRNTAYRARFAVEATVLAPSDEEARRRLDDLGDAMRARLQAREFYPPIVGTGPRRMAGHPTLVSVEGPMDVIEELDA